MGVSAVGSSIAPSAEAIFLEYARHSREDVRRVFERYDADGDGSLSGVEMRNLLRDVGLVSAFNTAEDATFLEKQLAAADRDGDGMVAFDEFTVYLNTVAAPRTTSTKARRKTGTKISFFAENDLFVTDPFGDARSRRSNEAACAGPGTPELDTERGRRELSRHGTRSRIPTPPAQYSSSKASARASPGSATKFGFASLDSPATPARAFGGPAREAQRARLRRLETTPSTPCAGFVANARGDTPTPEAVDADAATTRKTKKKAPPRIGARDVAVSEVEASPSPSPSPSDTPSPLPAFARPSRVHDAAGDLLAFVRDLEREHRRLGGSDAEAAARESAFETEPSRAATAQRAAADVSAADVSAADVSAADVSEATPSRTPRRESLDPESRESVGVSVVPTRAIEEATRASDAAASAAGGAREDDSNDAAETRVQQTLADTKTASNASRVDTRVVRSRASGRALVARAGAACLALLLLAASRAFLRGPRGSLFLETCPAPNPITATRAGSKPSGLPRVEPNVILPRESFPATETWTF